MRLAIGGDIDILDEARATDTLIIGWSKIPELLTMSSHQERRDALSRVYKKKPEVTGKHAHQVDRFLNRMSVGDLVLIAPMNPREYYIAQVAGDAVYIPEHAPSDTAFRRPAIWLNRGHPFSRRDAPEEIRHAFHARREACWNTDVSVETIRQVLRDEDLPLISSHDLEEVVRDFEEGQRIFRESASLVRNPRLVREAKRRANGRCELCNLDTASLDPEIGHKVLECHHLDPFAERRDDQISTSIDRVLVVCANCHRLLHARRHPAFTPTEIADRLRRNHSAS